MACDTPNVANMGATCDTYDGGLDNFAGSDKTNRKGVARKSYNRDSDADYLERIGALAVIGKRDGTRTEDLDNDPNNALTANNENNDIWGDFIPDRSGPQPMNHFWAEEVGATAITNASVQVADKDANTVVVETVDDRVVLAKYDSNDQYNHLSTADGGTAGGVTMATFEDTIEATDQMDIDLASDPEPGVNVFSNDSKSVPAPVTCHN